MPHMRWWARLCAYMIILYLTPSAHSMPRPFDQMSQRDVNYTNYTTVVKRGNLSGFNGCSDRVTRFNINQKAYIIRAYEDMIRMTRHVHFGDPANPFGPRSGQGVVEKRYFGDLPPKDPRRDTIYRTSRLEKKAFSIYVADLLSGPRSF